MKEFYSYAVVIGRFQPVHKAHIKLIEKALKVAEQVIIVLGSHRSAPTVKNPWTTQEREKMIISCFPDFYKSPNPEKNDYVFKLISDGPRISFVEVKDHPYNDTYWMTEVQQKISERTGGSTNIVLVGCRKDKSSFYLDFFPQWGQELIKETLMAATEIRHQYFKIFNWEGGIWWENKLHSNVLVFLEDWMISDTYKKLADEFAYYENYKKSFSNVPFPVTFVTTDAVVVKSGHVLLIRRKVNPGKGLLALPGGFVNSNETLLDCAFRELKEETRIKIDKKILKSYLVDQRVFDHPNRSLRGRSITHAYFVKLPDGGELPQVKGDDDAAGAFWMPIGDLPMREPEFFEDHMAIIQHFIWRV